MDQQTLLASDFLKEITCNQVQLKFFYTWPWSYYQNSEASMYPSIIVLNFIIDDVSINKIQHYSLSFRIWVELYQM